MNIANIQELEIKDLPDAVISELVKLAAIGAAVVECKVEEDNLSHYEIADLMEMNDFDSDNASAVIAISWLETL